MSTKSISIGIIIVLVVAAIAAFWFIANQSGQEKGRTTVRIGAILPLTGGGAEFGKDNLVGAQMAIDAIKATPHDVKIELAVEDSLTEPRHGVSAYRKIMDIGLKPVAILTVMSSVSSALAPLADKDEVPLFCVAAAPDLTRGKKYVFRALPAADYQARTLLQMSKVRLGYNTVSILYITDEFGTSMESAFTSAAQERGVKVLHSEGMSADASDFRPGLAKLLDSKPDAIYIAAFGSLLGSAVRQVRELGYKGTVLTTLEIGYPKVLDVAGEAAENCVFVTTQFDPSSSDAATRAFVEDFQKRAGRVPSLDAVLAYDEVQMIFLAGSRKGFTTQGVRAGLLETKDYKSLNGLASVLPNGDVAYALVLKVIRNGRPVQMQ